MGTEEKLHYLVHLPSHHGAQAQQPATQQEAVPPDRHQTVRQAGVGDVAQGQEGENQEVEEQQPALQQESLPPDRVDYQAVRQAFLPCLKQLDEVVTSSSGSFCQEGTIWKRKPVVVGWTLLLEPILVLWIGISQPRDHLPFWAEPALKYI